MTSIPFVREFDFEYGRCDTLSPLIRRVIAPNPGPFTFTGTGVYIIGHGSVAVIDPGPVDPAHIAAIDAALEGETVSHVFVTHHHLDHSPLAHPLAEKHGARVYGFGPQQIAPAGGEVRLEAGDDVGFQPDVQIEDEEIFHGAGWTLQALHTPGHTSNHVCYALIEENTLFSGDHVMGWSTTIVAPPGGNMGDYMASLDKLIARADRLLLPGHGGPVSEPTKFMRGLRAHRKMRERAILERVIRGDRTIPEMVAAIYRDTDPRLHGAAGLSVLAHLEDLVARGAITADGEARLDAHYAPA